MTRYFLIARLVLGEQQGLCKVYSAPRSKIDRSLGFRELGLRPGDKAVIFSENRPEWVMTDFAILCAGGVTVPIYPSLMPEQVKYIINDADAQIVVCSNRELWLKVEAVRKDLAKVRHFVMIDEEAPEGLLTLGEVAAKGRPAAEADPGVS